VGNQAIAVSNTNECAIAISHAGDGNGAFENLVPRSERILGERTSRERHGEREKNKSLSIGFHFSTPLGLPARRGTKGRGLNAPFQEAPRSAHSENTPSRAEWRVLGQGL
jgi:hypothetical protein